MKGVYGYGLDKAENLCNKRLLKNNNKLKNARFKQLTFIANQCDVIVIVYAHVFSRSVDQHYYYSIFTNAPW